MLNNPFHATLDEGLDKPRPQAKPAIPKGRTYFEFHEFKWAVSSHLKKYSIVKLDHVQKNVEAKIKQRKSVQTTTCFEVHLVVLPARFFDAKFTINLCTPPPIRNGGWTHFSASKHFKVSILSRGNGGTEKPGIWRFFFRCD